MNTSRRSIPFSVSILALLVLIVVPLSSALLWLGWRSVDALEERNVQERMTGLNIGVSTALADGLRLFISIGQTLALEPSFAAATPAAEAERRGQLVALLRRHANLTAAYVGYDDGRFLYAGRVSVLSQAQWLEFGAPDPDAIIVRAIAGEGAARRETWRFIDPGNAASAERSRPNDFDPRERPWYVAAKRQRAPILTEPYRFALSGEPGISAALPLAADGVLGFDFALGTLARLLADYKITPNAIVALAAGASDVLIETEPCLASDPDCLLDDGEARRALRTAVANVAAGGEAKIDRELLANGRRYRLIARLMPPQLGRPFSIASIMPISELSEASHALVVRAAILAGAAVSLAVLAALAASLLLSRPIRHIAGKTERIRNLDFSDLAPVSSRIREIVQLSDAVERLREGLQVFGRYVSKDLVTQVMRSPDSTGVGGVRRELTVMFTDIQGFSRISENMEPELMMSRLSRYFEALGTAISANRGMIDKYIGDSIMAFWNAPEPDPDHIADACRAALQAAEAGRRLGEKWRQRGRPAFNTRFGLHTGLAVVGNVGARERINYTLVGAVANQASRLEGLNKVYGTEILASGDVAIPTASQFVWRHIDRVVAAGTTETMEIYEPLGTRPGNSHTDFLQLWDRALAAYFDRRFTEASALFATALARRPRDGPCQVFLQRCETFAREGVPTDWDGAWHFDEK